MKVLTGVCKKYRIKVRVYKNTGALLVRVTNKKETKTFVRIHWSVTNITEYDEDSIRRDVRNEVKRQLQQHVY